MRKILLFLLMLSVLTTGCFKDEEVLLSERPEAQRVQPADSVWTVCIEAVTKIPGQAGNDVITKGLAFEGSDEDVTTVIRSIWKNRDPVQVYLGTSFIGTLYATPDETDPHKATLTGTVTASVIVPGTTELTLLTPRNEWNYTGQAGKLLKTDYYISGQSNMSIEQRYHYTMAQNVLVTDATVSNDSGKASLVTENATFENQQSIYRLSFRFQKDGAGEKTPIPAKRISITAADGGLVQTQRLDGTATTGAIEVVQYVNDKELLAKPLFVALRNLNTTEEEALNFKVIDPDGVTYYGSKTIPAEYKPNGSFVSIKNATLTSRLELKQDDTKSVSTVL